MVSSNIHSILYINIKVNSIANLNLTIFNNTCVDKLVATKLNTIINLNVAVIVVHCTTVAYLTTHFSIERSLVNNDRNLIAFTCSIYNSVIAYNSKNLCTSIAVICITNKFSRHSRVKLVEYSFISTHISVCCSCISSSFFLLLHFSLEGFHIHCHTLFFKNFFH